LGAVIGAFYDATMLTALMLTMAVQATGASDAVHVTLPESKAALLAGGPAGGRMILFLIEDGALDGSAPIEAPFFSAPQPMMSVSVDALVPGRPVVIDDGAISFPGTLSSLEGRFRVQALFDRNRTERGHLVPGNLVTSQGVLDLRADRVDRLELDLTEALLPEPRADLPNLRWFEVKSQVLTGPTGEPVTLRAGVALPPGWEDPNHRRRMFPAVYVIPGFGGRWTGADTFARMLATPGSDALVAQAAWIVLDPECPLGHHGFVDSAANGPWARALVTELIPALERQFRLIRRPEARLLTGHSSGGWSALWLQLTHPETFGGCFASAPDPVDFAHFQTGDIYRDVSIFVNAEGRDRPSYRVPVAPGIDRTRMTVRQEVGMERVLGPRRDSGEQWDAWSAMWSAVDPATRLPRPLFDAETGIIDREVATAQWSRFDIARLVRADPARFVPILRTRVRLLCGERDGFFLERAVRSLGQAVDAAVAARAASIDPPFPAGPGYITVVPGETHDTMATNALLRWHPEMRRHLAEHGLD
jgi:hypothetical protein